MSILLIVTGGTLDKDYQETTGELIFSQTHLDEMLSQARVTCSVQIQTLMLKDSLEMTEQDRDIILNACQNTKHQKIVITHGTDTMALTGQHLKKNLQPLDKTVVLTGAMRPFKLGHSDSLFNLGSALMAVNLSKSGVYITMNGQLFDADQVFKNKELGIFEKVSPNKP